MISPNGNPGDRALVVGKYPFIKLVCPCLERWYVRVWKDSMSVFGKIVCL